MKLILYAEDEPDDVFFMQRAFRKTSEMKLVSVENGALAVDYLLGKGSYTDRSSFPLPDLLLLDLNMPQMNGFDVLKFVRESETFKTLPVVMLTSSDNPRDQSRAAELRATDYLTKPNNSDSLTELINVFAKFC